MKILKVLFAGVAVAGVVYAGVLLAQFALDARELVGAAARYTDRSIPDPFQSTSFIAGIAAAAGLALGLAIGLPGRTAGQVRRATLDEANARRTNEIGNRAVAAERTAIDPDRPEAR
ncbi:hypothetical protein [Propioniciclava sp.]|uniref:hypothetical protein n=1 Tax=Propioniciclava sp. TaxID=2038686 RepID=UPI0026282663|nr:hypothetical protein [Propioniciclava sp.]